MNDSISTTERLIRLFVLHFGELPAAVHMLTGAGSGRCYMRLTGKNGMAVIGTVGEDAHENEAFFAFDKFYRSKALPVPEVIAVADDRLAYLQTDLGDVSLLNLMCDVGVPAEEKVGLMNRTMEVLARFHGAGTDSEALHYSHPRAAMDHRSVMWDLNYFKYCFLKGCGVTFDEDVLEDVLLSLADMVAIDNADTMILRDFQSRNVMVHDGEPYVIDFQGARMGNPLYDVASILWQWRLNLTDAQKMQYAGVYADAAKKCNVAIGDDWPRRLLLMALFRQIQVLGAYGFRGLFEHKAQFVTGIPRAVSAALGLLECLDDPGLEYLHTLLMNVARQKRFCNDDSSLRLVVRVGSFSYKRGIPEDYSGNGGGFVFDCRALHNPGRYDEYKRLTGLDHEVKEFIERDGGMERFLDSCKALVDASVDRYLKRGFTKLDVWFGCTGGQHRSVYAAQAMAGHLKAKFDVDVDLVHREQQIHHRL